MAFPGIDADIKYLAEIAEIENGKDRSGFEKLMDLTALINYTAKRAERNAKSSEGEE